MSSVRLAFVAANPHQRDGAPRQAEALRRVRDAIHASPLSRQIAVIEVLGATLPKLARVVREARPEILHFSGSGPSAGGGILLEGDDGRSQPVSTPALAELFRGARYAPRLLLLGCGHSDRTARALSRHALAAIGFAGELGEEAASVFSESLYRGVFARQPLRAAFAAAVESAVKSPAAILGEPERGSRRKPARLYMRPSEPGSRYLAVDLRPGGRERLARDVIGEG